MPAGTEDEDSVTKEPYYETKHLETRLIALYRLINISPSYPEQLMKELDFTLIAVNRIKLAQRLGIHPQVLADMTGK